MRLTPRACPRAARHNRRLYRPQVELLEDRCTPSVVNWDGGGDGVDWDDPLNWEEDALPGPLDDAVIGTDFDGITVVGGSATVNTVDSRANLEWLGVLTLANGGDVFGYFNLHPAAVLNVNGGNVALSNGGTEQGTFSIADPAAVISFVGGNFVMQTGAVITGPGYARLIGGGPAWTLETDLSVDNLDVSAQGTVQGDKTLTIIDFFRWTGGTLQNTLTTVQGAGDISGGAKLNGGTFKIPVGVTMPWNSGNITMSNGALIENRGTINITAPSSVLVNGMGGGSVDNYGTFSKVHASDTTIDVPFNNKGSGVISAAEENAKLLFTNEAKQPDNNARITAVKQSSRVEINKLEFGAGVLGGLGKIVITGSMDWSAGRMLEGRDQAGQLVGETVIDPSATAKIMTEGVKTIGDRILRNMGTVQWLSGDVSVLDTGIENDASGKFEIKCDKRLFVPTTNTGYFSNKGKVRKTSGALLGQGQLQLKPCAHYDFQQELLIPAATTTLHDEAVAAGMLLEQRQREAIEPGKVLPEMLIADA